jgi:hypothetical protein
MRGVTRASSGFHDEMDCRVKRGMTIPNSAQAEGVLPRQRR